MGTHAWTTLNKGEEIFSHISLSPTSYCLLLSTDEQALAFVAMGTGHKSNEAKRSRMTHTHSHLWNSQWCNTHTNNTHIQYKKRCINANQSSVRIHFFHYKVIVELSWRSSLKPVQIQSGCRCRWCQHQDNTVIADEVVLYFPFYTTLQ